MALIIVDPTRPDKSISYGTVFRLTPGRDASGATWSYGYEVQRAPDSAGSPGTPVNIYVTDEPLPGRGGVFVDSLSPSATYYHYRWREVGPGYAAGAYSAYLKRAAAPLTEGYLKPMLGNAAVLHGAIQTAAIEDKAVATTKIGELSVERSKIGATFASDLASLTSRSRFINGGFQDDLIYWNGNPTSVIALESGADVYKGSYSLKIPHTASAAEYAFQSTEPRVPDPVDAHPANWMQFAVRPSRRIQIDYSCKVSGANVIGRVYVAEYSASGGLLSTTQIGTDVTSTTYVDRSEEFTVGATTFWVVIRFGAEGTSSGNVWYDELYFTDLIPLNDTTGGWFDNGTKTGAFTLDFIKGATQWVEINGTNLAITLSNMEEGGVYVVYLKQNSSPDTVTWPASVHWKQAQGVFAPSATTGRIDRVTLQRINGVDYGSWETYWT